MCWKGTHNSRSPNIPEEYSFIVRTADEHVAFRGESERVDVITMTEKRFRIGFSLEMGINMSESEYSKDGEEAYSNHIP